MLFTATSNSALCYYFFSNKWSDIHISYISFSLITQQLIKKYCNFALYSDDIKYIRTINNYYKVSNSMQVIKPQLMVVAHC